MSGSSKKSRDESVIEKTGYEASDIIEDALQLAVDDELKEDREDTTSENGLSSKVNSRKSQKYSEDSAPEQRTGLLSPPKPESAPVLAPLTIEDKISMDTSKQRNTGTDDTSLIVNLDDTQNELLDGDIDTSDNQMDSSDNKSNRKSNNENTNCSDSKSDPNNDNKTNDDHSYNAKDLSKNSEPDPSKSKSANQRDSKIKAKESKTGAVTPKGQVSSARNIWVSGLSQNAKAFELQTIFSKHGKVVSAKIIKNAKMSASRCFGFITMENSDQVAKCIAQLNKTELHGKTISLSRNRPQESSKASAVRTKTIATKKEVNKTAGKVLSEVKVSDSNEAKTEDKKEEAVKRKSEEKTMSKSISESSSTKDSENKLHQRKPIRPPIRERPLIMRKPIMPPFRRPIPSFQRRPFPTPFIARGFHRGGLTRGGFRPHLPHMMTRRPDIERTLRDRERERRFREERRREEFVKLEEREERIRLEREKEKIRLERMKLEREKFEWFKAERERARLERERIEREREELKRRQQTTPVFPHRVDDTRSRPPIVGRQTILSSSIGKRSFDARDLRPNDNYWEERKRLQQMQRIDSHIVPARQTFVESGSSVGNRHTIPHSYDNRNDSYKRSARLDIPMTGSRSEFDARRHDSRHGIGHDRDDRKTTGPTYYRGETSRNALQSRDRRLGPSQREDWKIGHDSRPSDRYSEKPLGGSGTGFRSTSRYNTESRGWSDRSNTYGSGGMHMSGGQQWTASSGGRWNSAINSNDSRSRGQPNMSSSVISSGSHSITELFGSAPMSGLNIGVSHSMTSAGANNLSSGDRPYIHHNSRRF